MKALKIILIWIAVVVLIGGATIGMVFLLPNNHALRMIIAIVFGGICGSVAQIITRSMT